MLIVAGVEPGRGRTKISGGVTKAEQPATLRDADGWDDSLDVLKCLKEPCAAVGNEQKVSGLRVFNLHRSDRGEAGQLKSILDLGHIPSGMEGFFAADQEQLSYIKKIIDECDYYVLIVAGRYGSVDEEGISYTEREYDYAVSKGITVLAFVHGDIASLPPVMVDADPDSTQRLKSFRDKVSKRRLVRFWRDREQLKSDIIISLVKAMGDAPGVGWVRGNLAATETILTQLNEVRNEVEPTTFGKPKTHR